MTDKSSIQQILGILAQRPQLLSEVDKYSLTITDFSNRFEKYLFLAITGLYKQGATSIEPIDVANFLEQDPSGKKFLMVTMELNIYRMLSTLASQTTLTIITIN